MTDKIWVQLRGKYVEKEFELTARAAGVYAWPDWLTGVLQDLSQDEVLAFLGENGVVEAAYKAQRYRLRLVEREGRFQAWLAVKPEPAWPTELKVQAIVSGT